MLYHSTKWPSMQANQALMEYPRTTVSATAGTMPSVSASSARQARRAGSNDSGTICLERQTKPKVGRRTRRRTPCPTEPTVIRIRRISILPRRREKTSNCLRYTRGRTRKLGLKRDLTDTHPKEKSHYIRQEKTVTALLHKEPPQRDRSLGEWTMVCLHNLSTARTFHQRTRSFIIVCQSLEKHLESQLPRCGTATVRRKSCKQNRRQVFHWLISRRIVCCPCCPIDLHIHRKRSDQEFQQEMQQSSSLKNEQKSVQTELSRYVWGLMKSVSS